jgi:signal transduction histidine kinase
VDRDCAEVGILSGAESSRAQLQALRRFGNNIGLFWSGIVYAGVLLAVLSILVTDPAFYAAPRGWAALALAVCYLAAFTYGSSWMAGRNPDSYWKQRLNIGRAPYPWRAVILWATLVTLCIAMIALNNIFVWLIWVPMGMSLSLLPMPRSLLLAIPTLLLALAYYGELPTSLAPEELLKFAGFAMGLAVYCAVIYLPMPLLRSRFRREQMFLRLEQQHRDLEEAHQRLAEAAEDERELAVLRERGRLARDMHDTLGHSLALMAVKLEAAQRLRAVDPARADHEVVATQAIARGALAELRDAIANLRASEGSNVTREPLGDALTHAAEASAARAGWRLTCEIASDVEPVSEQAYEALLRTGIEALTNSERHAHAQSVHLTLTRQGDLICLRLEDDGVGILTTNPPQRVRVGAQANGALEEAIISPRGHFGITGMRERTTVAGGAFTIGAGTDGRGACVEARLPTGDV